MKISNTLKEYRSIKNCSQDFLAKQLNISTRHYQNIENGSKIPNVYTAIRIADFYDIADIRELFKLPSENSSPKK